MKKVITIIAIAIISTSCRTLNSTTYIKANDSFVLGNNEHGGANVNLKNTSANDIEVYQAPITGGKYSLQKVKPNESINVKLQKNTALIIDNKSNLNASVKLKVKGDLGLSMEYKNPY